MTHLKLRPYQQEWIKRITAALSGKERPTGSGVINRPAIVAPTGSGKTVGFSALIQDYMELTGGRYRVLVLTHRDEIGSQAAEKILSTSPGLSVGRVQAHRNETGAQVIVGSVPTLANPARAAQLSGVGLIIADECHHAAADTWRLVMDTFGSWRGLPTVGFTATMSRADDRGLGEIWQEIVWEQDILWMIRRGYLVDVRGKLIQVPQLDLTEADRASGDLSEKLTGAAMLNADAGVHIAKAYREHASDRPGVIFGPTVAAAESFQDEMSQAGLPTELITGATSRRDRGKIYGRVQNGDTQVLSSVGVLTEGFDMPILSCAVIARPTHHAGLYQQMVGRVLRPARWAGKRDALVLDVVGASQRHGLAGLSDLVPDRPGAQLADGQSVREAVELWELEDGGAPWEVPPAPAYSGPLITTDVDLFAESDSLWLQTARGTWFIPAGDWLVFLWPEPDGLFTVASTSSKRRVTATALQHRQTFDLALAWAEQYAAEYDPQTYSHRKASWRRKPASPAQLNKIRGYAEVSAAQLADVVSQGDASDVINRAIGTRRLDV